MRRTITSISVAVAIIVSPVARAEGSLTDAQLNSIVTNCVNAQIILQRVQASERVARTNRGQLYETTQKLMTNLNGRVAQYRIDTSSLVNVTSDYQKLLETFHADYNPYDDAMSALTKMDCRNRPTDFNDQLAMARHERAKLNADVVALDALLNNYQRGLDALKQQVGSNQ